MKYVNTYFKLCLRNSKIRKIVSNKACKITPIWLEEDIPYDSNYLFLHVFKSKYSS